MKQPKVRVTAVMAPKGTAKAAAKGAGAAMQGAGRMLGAVGKKLGNAAPKLPGALASAGPMAPKLATARRRV